MNQAYSYIDVAALDAVRLRFAAGEALAILNVGLDEVIWANGPGAALLGFPDVEAAIGAGTALDAVARRQISAAPGFPALPTERALMVRLRGAILQPPVRVVLNGVTLPDGENAVLLSARQAGETQHDADAKLHALSGFNEEDQRVAFVDGEGRIIAAAPGFERLQLPEEELASFCASLDPARGRVGKRRLSGAKADFPAGIARLSDDPAVHFLIVIDQGVEAKPETAAENGAQVNALRDAEGTTTVLLPAAPIRFTWRTDADGRFSMLSPEFIEALGEASAGVTGRPFREVAQELGFDESGEIAGLLERRDTWSGRSVLWPVDGTTLRVPVDLAALPVYDRDRRFQGFRGFGMVRLAEALEQAAPDTVAAEVLKTERHDPVPQRDDEAIGHQPFEPDLPILDLEQLASEEAFDPLPDQQPVIADRPVSEENSENVIRLAAHRPASAERAGLSPVERNAFREIGHRLKAVEGDPRANEPVEAADEDRRPAEPVSVAPKEGSAATTPAGSPTGESEKPGSLQPGGKTKALSGKTKTFASAPEGDGNEDFDAQLAIEGAGRWRPAPRRTVSALPDLPTTPRAAGTDGEDDRPDDTSIHSSAATDPVSPELDGGLTGANMLAAEELPLAAREEDEPIQAEETPLELNASSDDSVIAADQAGTASGEEQDEESKAPAPSAIVVPIQGDTTDGDGDTLPRPASASVQADIDEDSAEPTRPDLALFEALPLAILVCAGDRLHFANRAFLDLTGYASLETLEEAGGLDALIAPPLDETAADEVPHLVMRRADGVEEPVSAHLQSVPWGSGKSLMLSLRPIPQPVEAAEPAPEPAPDHSQAEAELERVRTLLDEMRTIVDTATDGVVLITPEGTIRMLSRPAEALFGMDAAAVSGKPFISLFAIESQRSIRDYLTGLTDNGVASVLNDGREVIGREAQGRFIPLFMTIGKLPAGSGFCAVVRDITQWKRAEEELTQARAQAERTSSQKTEFLARVSHEIRTPLNAIIGFSELMMEERFGPVGNDRYRGYLRDINRSGNHVLDLVNDLLDISKIEAGEQELAYVAVSVNDALAEAVAIMQPQANRERVIIRSSFASRLPDVVADLRSVRQIALNLLSNAVRYTQAGGQVIVSTVYENGEVILRIRDTGVGMSSAEIDQALKPFKQVNALQRARGEGTGLGLPLTKAMVEANRARFTISSRPAEGTLIEITFPSTRVLAD